MIYYYDFWTRLMLLLQKNDRYHRDYNYIY